MAMENSSWHLKPSQSFPCPTGEAFLRVTETCHASGHERSVPLSPEEKILHVICTQSSPWIHQGS